MTKEGLAVGATFLVANVQKYLRPEIEEHPAITFIKEMTAVICLSREELQKRQRSSEAGSSVRKARKK